MANDLQFHYVSYQNLMSVGDNAIRIDLDRDPTTLICGLNGAGKSTLLEALSFGLFGKSYRGINKPNLVNSINQKRCLVEVEFTRGSRVYKVVRGIGPAKFDIYEDEKKLDKQASVNEQQSFLEENILGMNFNTFSKLSVVGAASYEPFMLMTAPKRREFVDDILDLQVFTEMNNNLKKKVSTAKSEYVDLEKVLTSATTRLDVYTSLIERTKTQSDDKIERQKNRIDEYDKSLSDLYAKKEKLIKPEKPEKTDTSDLTEQTEKLRKIQKKTAETETEIRDARKRKTFFENNAECPTCEQNIPDSYSGSIMDDLDAVIKDGTSALEKLEKLETKTTNVIQKTQKRLEEYNRLEQKYESDLRELAAEIRSIETQKKTAETEIETLRTENTADTADAEEKIRLANETITETSTSLEAVKSKLRLYGRTQNLLKDTGVKSLIIKKYIPLLNKYVNEYLRLLNFNVTFELDENFNESLKSRYKSDFKYMNFSMGERQRLDLAIMFAWVKVARSKNSLSTNLLILDEVEGYLDKAGADDVLEISEHLADEMNVFIISHKPDLGDRVYSIIEMYKEGGFTRMR